MAQAGKISQSFMYARPVIDGDDLAINAPSRINAPNQHDTHHATFHGVKNFRSLALKLTPKAEEQLRPAIEAVSQQNMLTGSGVQ